MAEVRRQVAQVAGESHTGGDGAGVFDRTLDFGLAGLVGQQGDLFQGARLGLLALETVEDVFAVEQGFGQQAVFTVMGVAVVDRHIVQGQHCIGTVQALEYAGHAGNQLAPGAVAQGFILATAYQQHALGLQARKVLQQQGLARLAGQVAALEHGANGTLAGQVDSLGHSTELAVFTYRNDQCGGFYGCSSYAFYNQFHVRIPE